MNVLVAAWQSMTDWNRFVTACIVVGGLLLKSGVPVPSILLGLAAAALVNWQIRRRRQADPSVEAGVTPRPPRAV